MSKTKILIVGTPQQYENLIQRLPQEHDVTVYFQERISFDVLVSITVASRYDVIVYFAGTETNIDALINAKVLQKMSSPVVFVKDNLTINQTVDLMNAGVKGVVPPTDTDRLVTLISRTVEVVSSQSSDLLYKEIVDSQSEFICRYDTDLRLRYANRAYCDWQALSFDELVGTSIIEKIPPKDRDKAIEHVQSLTSEQPVAASTHKTILPDGTIQTIEWTDRAVFDADGNIIEYQGVGRDVTAREEQAQELQSYRVHMNAVLATMQDALMTMSLPERETIFVSHAFESVFGYPHKNFIDDPKFFMQVVHPDDLETAIEAQQTCLREGFAEFDHRVIWPDGQVRWLHRRAWINYDENGQPVRVNDSASDITDRIEAERSLATSEELHRVILSTISDAVFITDDEGQFTFICPNTQIIFGYSHDEVASLETIQELTGRIAFDLSQLKQDKEIANIEHRIVDKWGTHHDLLINVKDISIGEGTILYSCRDVTEHKQAQNKFEVMFRTNPAMVGLSSIETGEYVEVNDAFCEKLGFTRDEVIGVKATELLKLDPEWRMKTLQKLQAQGYVHNEETVILAKDGTPVPVMLFAEVIVLHGKQYNFTTAIDITDLKRAEHALRSSEEQLKSLVDSQTNYLVRIDLEGRYTYWNPKFEQDYGWLYGSKRIGGRSALDSIARYHHQRTAETVSKCLAAPGVPIQVELDKPALTGNFQTLLWEFICLTDANDAPIGFQCIGIDISDFKKAQATVQQQSNILQQVSDAIIIVDNDRKITSWNKAATDIYGWTEDEVIGHVMEELVQAEWLTDSKAFALATYESTDKWQGELREKDKSGRELYIITSVNRLYNEYGEPVGGVLINRDMTSKKKADQVMQMQNEILHQSQDLIAMADLSGVITYMNQGGATLLGAKSPDELIGKLFTSTHPPAEAERTIKEYLPHALEKGYWRGENRLKTLDGHVIDVDQVIFPIHDKDGKFISAASIIIDISANKRAENALRQSEERFNQFMRYLPGAVFIKDGAEQTLYCNDLYASLIGKTSEEIIGQNTSDYISSEIAPLFVEENEQVLNQGCAIEFNHDFPGAHGVSHWRTIKFPIPRDRQEPLIGAISLDITTIKQAEDRLKRSEQRYRQMFELVSLPKLITDPNTARILDANPAAVDFYGYPLKTLKTMTMMQINVADSKETLEKMAKVLVGGFR